ncbi:hypothetical protein [Niabella ginsengisoli]|uniref:Energy transducer TonB n=1 Tax=Niabella ginsengisoli TaxID=522298 RepID=A0ABS9SE62_9BACT|nr:hypothetical protein [Niabella ginsengisoli]MCH5596649.1 hypothetical protein [Niabella ginsengisoli]
MDLLFEGRNKSYGAYELRRSYRKRMIMALGFTVLGFALIAGGIYLNNQLKGSDDTEAVKINEVTIQQIEQEKPEEPPPPPPPPPPKQAPPLKLR